MMSPIHGIFNVKKPVGISSHDVVNHIRRQFDTRKVGHAGTLDVEASGVLLVGINEGTKLLPYLQTATKTYHFGVTFGQETDTLDHVGNPINEGPTDLPDWLDCDAFVGPYSQVPPAYSAVKVAGKKLYEYAREGAPIPKVPARQLTISAFQQNTPLTRDETFPKATFTVSASSGLYVRKLALDLAMHHGTFAHTHFITRRSVGAFTLEESTDLETLSADHIIRLSDALVDFEPVRAATLDPSALAHGRSLNIPKHAPRIQVITATGGLLGLYEWHEHAYKPLRIFKGD